jgi:hypothetical protein
MKPFWMGFAQANAGYTKLFGRFICKVFGDKPEGMSGMRFDYFGKLWRFSLLGLRVISPSM